MIGDIYLGIGHDHGIRIREFGYLREYDLRYLDLCDTQYLCLSWRDSIYGSPLWASAR